MLVIPEAFWKEELRDGFYVSEVMKRAWAVQLAILDAILEVTEKHDIHVWLEYGSLLGAIRHHGYIPWDDDLDISVMRKDYIPLIRYLQEELPSNFFIESLYTTQEYNQPKAVVSNRDHFDIGNNPTAAEITKTYYGFPCSAWVDIFPMDYIPADINRWKTIRSLYSAAYNLAYDMDTYIASGEFEAYLIQLENIVGTKVNRDENIRNSVWMLAEKIATMTTKKEAKYCVWYPEQTGGNDIKRRRNISAYSNTIWVDYEFTKAPIPEGYLSIIHSIFGENYMTPIRGQTGHSYPYYQHQERAILHYSKLGQLGDIY
jgi:lipopolysaccharide cholinephosphotransferase